MPGVLSLHLADAIQASYLCLCMLYHVYHLPRPQEDIQVSRNTHLDAVYIDEDPVPVHCCKLLEFLNRFVYPCKGFRYKAVGYTTFLILNRFLQLVQLRLKAVQVETEYSCEVLIKKTTIWWFVVVLNVEKCQSYEK